MLLRTATGANQSTAVSAPPLQTPQQPPPPPPNGPQPMTAPAQGGPPAPPPSVTSYMTPAPSSHMTPASSTHMSPLSHLSPAVSEPGPSPHSSIATPPNYGLYTVQQPTNSFPASFYHADVPTIGFNSLSSWAAYGGSTAFLNAAPGTTPSSLANFEGKAHHYHPHQHQHHNSHGAGNIIIYDHAQP